MTRAEIISNLKKYFSIQELVCGHTYRAFGDRSWQFIDTALLHTLLVVREDILGVPMLVNGGKFSQRGFRCNLCQLVRDMTKANKIYLTSHANGAGIDFSTSTLSAEECRQKIKAAEAKLPYKIRLEDGVTWVHMDVYDNGGTQKVSYFRQ